MPIRRQNQHPTLRIQLNLSKLIGRGQMPDRKVLSVRIKLEGDGFANPAEFELRYTLEDEIMDREIGDILGAGSGGGWMDFAVLVDNAEVDTALTAIRQLLTEQEVAEDRTEIEIMDFED